MSNDADTATVPRQSDTTRQRRIGCLLGCEGFTHDPGCTVGLSIPRPACLRPCQAWTIAALRGDVEPGGTPQTCPCATGEDR